jgi:hypothetical protein
VPLSSVGISGTNISYTGPAITNGPGSYSYGITATSANGPSLQTTTNSVVLLAIEFKPLTPLNSVLNIDQRLTWSQFDITDISEFILKLYKNNINTQTIRLGAFDYSRDGKFIYYSLNKLQLQRIASFIDELV